MTMLYDLDITGTQNYEWNDRFGGGKGEETVYPGHTIFFSDGFELYEVDQRDENDLTLLTLGVDYDFIQRDEKASERSGKDCYRALMVHIGCPLMCGKYYVYADQLKAYTINEIHQKLNGLQSGLDNLYEMVNEGGGGGGVPELIIRTVTIDLARGEQANFDINIGTDKYMLHTLRAEGSDQFHLELFESPSRTIQEYNSGPTTGTAIYDIVSIPFYDDSHNGRMFCRIVNNGSYSQTVSITVKCTTLG
jgi:hypothetical protein